IAAMADSGVFEIGSHTYDMHQSAEYEAEIGNMSPRIDMSRLDGESEADYLNALRSDLVRSFAEIEKVYGNHRYVEALAYPRGVWSNEAAAVLREDWLVKMTFSTEEGIHTVVRGLEQSLYCIKRFNVDGSMTPEDVLWRIGG
ncbi:MAG: polysaccharide deacetylase family protein, partial [Clostridia bacterium]|nr:polysaccharide deacetylase family protein [Clostridia bacterium]